MKTIGLEEHFITPELFGYSASTKNVAGPGAWEDATRRLTDFLELRIPEMNEHGLDIQVLSLTSPGIQAEKDTKVAVTNALKVNDFLKTVIDAHPTRFGGFAALPLQDPKAAADELERTVKQYGFSGGLINAHTQGKYLDHLDFDVVWERAVALDVPLYLHPAVGADLPHIFRGHEELIGPMWSWGVETGTHALRLIFGKVFDRYPNAKLLLGHMGEGLPYTLWRLDSRWAWRSPSRHRARPRQPVRVRPAQHLHHHERRRFGSTAALRAACDRRRAHPVRDRLPFRGDLARDRVSADRADQRGGSREDLTRERREAAAPQQVTRVV